MNGTRQLTWITAVTITSLLLGTTVLTAFASDSNGGRGRGSGSSSGQGAQAQRDDRGRGGDDARRGGGEGRGDGTRGRGASANDASSHSDDDRDGQPSVVTRPGQVTPPATVTALEPAGHHEDDDGNRPGWGCGDDNHEHSGPPGNPNAESPCRHDD